MAKKKTPIDPLGSPNYGLKGRIVTMNDNEDILDNGIIFIKDSNIAAIIKENEAIPSQFSDFPIINCSGTIFPGLIELHNHLSYNCLPMWQVPKTYGNRSQWGGTPTYRKLISGPMSVLGKTPGYVEAIVRYVEAKCLLGGVTTSQGIALFSNNGIQKFYRGIVRNIENTDEIDLPDVNARIPDIESKDILKFFKRLKSSSCFLLHLSEGKDASAHKHFEALQMPDGQWAINEALGGIHSVALTKADYKIMKEKGASMVWSPLSNLMLYGQTADVKAAKEENISIGIGSDWSPSGSKNLLGELKIAKLYSENNGNIFTDFEIIAMATKNAAKIIKWEKAIGTIEVKKRADLLIINGKAGNAYENLLSASEASINLVVINGIPRYGKLGLMNKFGDITEEYKVKSSKRGINFMQATGNPVVGSLTLKAATEKLVDGLKNIKTLAVQLNNPIAPSAAIPTQSITSRSKFIQTPQTNWYLVLDHNEEEGSEIRTHLPFEGEPTMALKADISQPLETILEPIALDPITVIQDENYFTNLKSQMNLPDYIKQNIEGMY